MTTTTRHTRAEFSLALGWHLVTTTTEWLVHSGGGREELRSTTHVTTAS